MTLAQVDPGRLPRPPRRDEDRASALDPRRLLGKYYTPEGFAEILVRWALADVRGTVLDPSYGGCAFLNAATRVLSERGIENPGGLVYGVDVDPSCADFARRSELLIGANCITRDFLATSPTGFPGAPFAAVAGNPPYVRHHWLKGARRTAARAIAAGCRQPLPATASVWAYFVLHALTFLAPGGRLAMLVPEAILQAKYAAPLRATLAERFRRSSLIYVRDRQFDGTDEPVVVVASSGYGERGSLSIESIERPDELTPALADCAPGARAPFVAVVNGRRTTEQTLQVLAEIERHDAVKNLAELATVRIGLVTGANGHFIRSRKDLDRLGVPDRAVYSVVARTKWLAGLDFTHGDHDELAKEGAAAFLVRPANSDKQHAGVNRWIAEGLERGVHKRFKCAARLDWCRVELPPAPDAFATCCRLGAPRLSLNRTSHRCSNTLHSVRWKPNLSVVPEAVAVGFLTSVVAVWAELFGRRYGGGVLKIEPSSLNRIPIPVVRGAEDVFDDLDQLLRRGMEDEARELADERVLRDGLGLTQEHLRSLLHARSQLKAQRRPERSGG